jgi:type II secretory pathway component PulM
MVSEVMQLRDSDGRGGAGTRRNLTSLINQSTARQQLQVTRLQPNSRGEIQVRLEAAAFDDLLLWLYEMEHAQALLVREVSITQAGSAGRVNATVRIAQAG